MNLENRFMVEVEVNKMYKSQDGFVLQREHGKTPYGNECNGRWVLRDAEGTFIDYDQYRNDLAERNQLKLTDIQL